MRQGQREAGTHADVVVSTACREPPGLVPVLVVHLPVLPHLTRLIILVGEGFCARRAELGVRVGGLGVLCWGDGVQVGAEDWPAYARERWG